MRKLVIKQQEAIELRKQGFTYSEIVTRLHVSKASLSLWIRGVPLPASYLEKIKRKQFVAHHNAKVTNRNKRIHRSRLIKEQAYSEITHITRIELSYIGVMLYWAEGSKQKNHNVSQRVVFGNSDLNMIKIFLAWLSVICKIDIHSMCAFELFIHESADTLTARMIWAGELKIPGSRIRIRLKKHNSHPLWKVNTTTYKGLLRVYVKKSTNLNRRIDGLIAGITDMILKTCKT